MDGRREPCAVRRQTHGHSQPRRENRKMWPQDTARGTNTLLDASGNPSVPAGGENVRIAVELLDTRPYSPRKPHCSSPAGAGRVQGWRRGPGAPANEPSRHGLGRAGQALEPGARYRGWETNAPNVDPGAWPPSHRNPGAKTLSLLAPRPRG